MARPVFKRWLYLTHRWIGIVSCLFFAMWFASGLVMVYVPFPALERAEWLAGQQPIAWERVRMEPADLLDGTPLPGTPGLRQVSLEMRGVEPVWRWSRWDGSGSSASAVDGRPLGPAGADEARALAQGFARAPVLSLARIHNDQWTVAERYGAHRPLWKAEMAGDEGRVVYVSSQTGQIMLQTTRSERFWNWLGAVPHWIYFTIIRQDQPLWRQVILWSSGPCIIGAITGIWVGLLRIRLGRRRFRDGAVTPYRGWMKWHHLTGLGGALFLLLWIFSGWLSVDPGRVFASEGPGMEVQAAYAGVLPPDFDTRRLAALAPGAASVSLASAAGHAHYHIEQAGRSDRVVDTGTFAAPRLGAKRVAGAIAALFPEDGLVAQELLTRPDAYWYSVRGEAALPVLRLKLGDEGATWVHADPDTGRVHGSIDRRRRVYRWLFDLFHRWDLNVLLDHRPARDVLIWVFSLIGLASSITGIWIGWLRLSRPGPKRARRTGAGAGS